MIDDPRLRSQFYAPAQLLALGRVTELSAQLEVTLRDVLGRVLGLGLYATEALFLGNPVQAMVTRIEALCQFEDVPDWLRDEAHPWAKDVARAIDARNDVIHRAPIALRSGDEEDDGRDVGWNAARRKHAPEPVDDALLLSLIDRLDSLQREAGMKLALGNWGRAFIDSRNESPDETHLP